MLVPSTIRINSSLFKCLILMSINSFLSFRGQKGCDSQILAVLNYGSSIFVFFRTTQTKIANAFKYKGQRFTLKLLEPQIKQIKKGCRVKTHNKYGSLSQGERRLQAIECEELTDRENTHACGDNPLLSLMFFLVGGWFPDNSGFPFSILRRCIPCLILMAISVTDYCCETFIWLLVGSIEVAV